MKFTLVIIFVIISFGFAYSQIVTTVPQFPTENDSITIYFDATQTGASELLNYTGTLYTHTGVTTNLGTWLHVKGEWGNNQTQPALTRDSANHYKLVIGYPRKYYEITDSSEHITALDFVFRSSDGSQQTRPDIFVMLYKPGINITLNSPHLPPQFGDPLRAPIFVNDSDTFNISASAICVGTKISSLTLFINNIQKAQVNSDTLNYDFVAANYQAGTNLVSIIGEDTSGLTDTLSFAIVKNPAVVQEPVPPGNEYGINYNSNTSVTLELFAPYKKFVYVIGDFNDWKVEPDYQMKKEEVRPDSVIWWLTITGLNPGEEYAFQYLVDGKIRIGDPYAEKILDPSNDQYISSSTYPNLKPYPAGKTNEIVSVLQTDQTPYHWQDTTFKRPAKTNLAIYELLVRDFVSTHDYNTLTDTISYFKRLGVNAIELLPIMEFEGNDSWGYNPDFDFAPDKYYGTKNDLKKFIDAAHQNGLAVILDAPMNDIFNSSPLARLYWDTTNNRPAADNPWLNPVATHPFNVGNDFNYSSPETKYYVNRFTKFWLTNYNVDGFRFDLAGGYTQNPNGFNNWEGYDQTRIETDKRIANAIWKVKPGAYVILEEFVDGREEDSVANYGLMVWDNMSSEYEQAAMGYATNPSWNLSGISYKSWGWNVPGLVGYMESHDEERLMYKNLQYGNSSGSYNIKDLSTALNRIKLCEAFFYTVPGPKMLWQFQELGYDYSINYNGRTGDKPIRWDYYSNPDRLKLFKTTAAFIKLKTEYPAFESNNFSTNLAGYIKTINISDSTMNVAIIGNFDVVQHNGILSFPNKGNWYEYFSGDSINVTGTTVNFPLNPGEFHVYTSVKLPTPEEGIISGVKNNSTSEVVNSYELEQNYPNPFNPTTQISYQISSDSYVTLKVYDILGNLVKTLVNGYRPKGKYKVNFNGSNLASGVYFYKLNAGNFISTKKMLLLK